MPDAAIPAGHAWDADEVDRIGSTEHPANVAPAVERQASTARKSVGQVVTQ